MPKILVIDDEKSIRKTLREILEYENFKVDEAGDGAEGAAMAAKEEYDIILCDIKMPKVDGIEALDRIQKSNPDTPVIMISGHGTIETAVEAVKKGAFDFIAKPLNLNRLLVTIRNAMEKITLVSDVKVLKKKISKTYEMIGESTAIQQIQDIIEKVAPTDARVLITGENGTRKEQPREQRVH